MCFTIALMKVRERRGAGHYTVFSSMELGMRAIPGGSLVGSREVKTGSRSSCVFSVFSVFFFLNFSILGQFLKELSKSTSIFHDSQI